MISRDTTELLLIASWVSVLLLIFGDWMYQRKRTEQRKNMFRKCLYEEVFISVCVSISSPSTALSRRWFRFVCWKAWIGLQEAHDDIELNELEELFRKECRKAQIEIVPDQVQIQIG